MAKFLKETGIVKSRADNRAMEQSLKEDYRKIDNWASRQKGLLVLDFEQLILAPQIAANKIVDFVQHPLDIEKMVACVEKRGTDCYPTMLEYKFFTKPVI